MTVRIRDLSSIRIERAEFASAGATVRGLLYTRSGIAAQTCVVLCHGYSASKHNVDPLAYHLAGEGVAALAIDFLGHKLGASFEPLDHAEDLVANALDAVAHARTLAGIRNVVLGGHSMGAATSIGAAAQDTAVAGVIVMCTARGRSRHLSGSLVSGLANRACYVDGASPAEISAAMDACTERIPEIAPRPILVIAAQRDALVAPSAVRELFEAAREPKTFEIVEATHTDAAERSKFVVVRWLRAHGFLGETSKVASLE